MKYRRYAISVIVLLIAVLLVFVFGWNRNAPRQPENKPGETDTSGKMSVTEKTANSVESVLPSPTPTRRIYRITNPPKEASTPVPPTSTPDPWRETEYPPTCEAAGYIVRENIFEGVTTVVEGAPALGHVWSEWTEDPETGKRFSTCSRCGKEISRTEIYTGTIPRIDFYGSMEGISKSDRVTLDFDFTSPTEVFTCYSYTTWQGHNTLNFPKKNFTIRLFNDEAITEKHRLSFKGWQREHKYVLKANYRDISQARNLIAANLWADMAASRPNLFRTLRHTSNFGAVDGFPVTVYLNGDFLGLYTMNLHIDDDLYQMDNASDVVMIANSSEPEECRFLAEAAFEDQKTAWEVEYCGTGDRDQWARDLLNELIRFVINSSDTEFRAHLADHMDVDAAVDYLIFLYTIGLPDNAAKDLVLLKYHDCDVWIPSVYDLEGAFGLNLETLSYADPKDFLPVKTDEGWNSCTGSLLWDRMLKGFFTEIQTRYAALREGLLTEDQLTDRVNDYIGQIPKELFRMDLDLYPRQVPEEDPREQMRTYIQERLMLLDAAFMEP